MMLINSDLFYVQNKVQRLKFTMYNVYNYMGHLNFVKVVNYFDIKMIIQCLCKKCVH